jgi:DNA-binding XRE family transcriptional regulator
MHTCSVADCSKIAVARTWCESHYYRWKKYGSPAAGKGPVKDRGSVRRYFEEVVLAYEGDECLFWPFARCAGYGQLKIGGKNRSVNRLACEKEHGPPPTPDHEAAHSCGNGPLGCCTKRHLSWKTPKQNKADELVDGTRLRGERHNMAKLTEADVQKIRSLLGHMSQSKIAKRFGVSKKAITSINRGQTWSSLKLLQTGTPFEDLEGSLLEVDPDTYEAL